MSEVVAVVDYNRKARDMCVGGERNLRIFYMQGNDLDPRTGNIVDRDDYSSSNIERLVDMGIPVVFRSGGNLPSECNLDPSQYRLMGKISYTA